MAPMSHSNSPQNLSFSGCSLNICMPDAESMIAVCQMAANHISGMADDANDENKRQQLQQFRQVILQQKAQIQGQASNILMQ